MHNVNHSDYISTDFTKGAYNPKSDQNISKTLRDVATKVTELHVDALEIVASNLMKLAKIKPFEQTALKECSQITELMAYADETSRNENNESLKVRLNTLANTFEPSSKALSDDTAITSGDASPASSAISTEEEDEVYEDDFEMLESDDEEVEAMSLFGSKTLQKEKTDFLPIISMSQKTNKTPTSAKSSNANLPSIHDKFSPIKTPKELKISGSTKLPKIF